MEQQSFLIFLLDTVTKDCCKKPRGGGEALCELGGNGRHDYIHKTLVRVQLSEQFYGTFTSPF